MTDRMGIALAALVLQTASGLIEEIDARTQGMGFDDLRPAHGFAFVRLSAAGATVTELAEHLGVTKQAASQLVEELVKKDYVARTPHPTDARAKLLVLTERGWAATRAADAASAAVVREWAKVLGNKRIEELIEDLSQIARPGRLRPFW